MTTANLYFRASCRDADTMDAFGAALSALLHPDASHVTVSFEGEHVDVPRHAALARRDWLDRVFWVSASPTPLLASGRQVDVGLMASRPLPGRRLREGQLSLAPYDARTFLPPTVPLPTGPRSREAEAAAAWLRDEDDLEDLLRRFAAPVRGGVVRHAGYARSEPRPLTRGGALYVPDAAAVGRELALAYLAAATGADSADLIELPDADLGARLDRCRHTVPIAIAPGALLSAEDVRAAMDRDPSALLEALEAASGADREWHDVETEARDLLTAAASGSPLEEVNVATRQHARFLIDHAPLRVRRLPVGGAILSTHPDRPLWPLFADALELLGVRRH